MERDKDYSLLRADEARVANAMLRSGSSEIKEILSELRAEMSTGNMQMLKECYQESLHEGKSMLAAMRQKLIQNNADADEIEAAAEYQRIMSNIPAKGIHDPSELRDSVDRLNRRAVAFDIDGAVNKYMVQEYDFAETVELIKAIGAQMGEVDPTVSAIGEIMAAVENGKKHQRIPYGIPTIDKYCLGLARRRMTVLAARPGVGKTDFGLHVARHNLKAGKNVFIASLEMDDRELGFRMGMAEGEGNYGNRRVMDGLNKISKWPGRLEVYDNGSASIAQISSRVKDDVDLVIVDYLQITRSRNEKASLYEKTTELSHDFRGASKRTQASWLVLSQLSREAKDEQTQPKLSHLRDSGAIEQDAYAILFLWTPSGRVARGADQDVQLDVAKNRGSGLGFANLFTNRELHQWWEV